MSQAPQPPWQNYGAIVGICAVLLSGFWRVVIEPIQSTQRDQGEQIQQLRIDNKGLSVHLDNQSTALNKLASAVDKLADKLQGEKSDGNR